MNRPMAAGHPKPVTPLEEGVENYIQTDLKRVRPG
jgi:hypothetical protein